MNEITILETDGIEMDNEKYFASIAKVNNDYLATHQMFNLKCCFRSDYICHLCSASTKIFKKILTYLFLDVSQNIIMKNN